MKFDTFKPKNLANLGYFVLKNFAKSFVLYLCLEKALSGYDIIKIFKEEKMSLFTASRVYPLLKKLKEQGLLSSYTKLKGKRKIIFYLTTKKGKEYLSFIKKWVSDGKKGEFWRFLTC